MDVSLLQIAIPAGAGLAGVAVGSLFTLLGQKIERAARYEDELRKHTVEVFASTMVYSAAITQVINRGKSGLSGKDLQAVLDKLNIASQTIHDRCVMLSIFDSGVLGKSAIAFSNVMTEATQYLHPAEGTGASDGYARAEKILWQVDYYREAIAEIARAPRGKRKKVARRLNKEIEELEAAELRGEQ